MGYNFDDENLNGLVISPRGAWNPAFHGRADIQRGLAIRGIEADTPLHSMY